MWGGRSPLQLPHLSLTCHARNACGEGEAHASWRGFAKPQKKAATCMYERWIICVMTIDGNGGKKY